METMLLTAADAAKTLRLSPRTLFTLTAKGCIQAVRIGRRVLYCRSDLEAFIDRQRMPTALMPIGGTC
jgi:excisionase family DNA binding protein